MLKNKKTIGLLFSSRADCRLLQDFLIQKDYRVSILQPEKFIPQDLEDINLIMAESSLARRFNSELLALKKTAVLKFSFLPLIVAISPSESVSPWLASGYDDVLTLPVDKDLLASRLQAWLRLQEETSGNLRELVERSTIGFYRTTPDGRILYANPAIIKMLGFASFEELARRNLEEEGFEPAYPRSHFKEMMEKEGEIRGLESVWIRKDGTRLWVRESAWAIKDESGKIIFYEGTVEDITERVEAEEAYLTIVENALQGIVLIQKNRVVFANPAMEKISGYSRDELQAFTPEQVRNLVHPEDRDRVWENMQRRMKGEEVPSSYEFRFLHKNGEVRWVKISATRINYRGEPAILASYLDITEEKRLAERLEAIHRVGQRLALVNSSGEIARIIIAAAKELLGLDEVGLYLLDSAQEQLKLIGHSPEVPPGPEIFPLKADRGIVPLVARTGESLYLSDVSKHSFYVPGARETRSEFCVPLKLEERIIGVLNVESPQPDAFSPQDQKLILTLAEVASMALGRAEYLELLLESEERFEHLARSSPDIIYRYRFQPERGLDYISPAVTKITGYTVDEFHSDPDLWMKIIHPEDRVFLEKTFNEPDLFKQPMEMRLIGKGGESVWMEQIVVPLYDEEGNLIALDGIARDITERKRAARKIEDLLNQVVMAFSSAMELRDPYTAGHQRRVTELALAIAQEMGLSGEQLKGLQVASLLHDIGKGLFVPAEILSKPGQLTVWEMALIKIHPQAGYEVLKKVDFPWPVAEIVHQHHERLDGSGYPQGLKDKDILLEAKIIAVADVVEAMSSHRPYRPSLGTEKALEEIEAQKGVLYDPQVVEACLRVFARGFSFSP
jgi:PAS domain S-box-containing protein/putative nucleotidyltransferase with HDIG domain